MGATFSNELLEHFQAIRGTILTAQLEWAIAKQLFASGEENMELLNWSANYAFWAIQRALYLDVVMAIGRLTDPATMGRNENLSLDRLTGAIQMIDPAKGASIKQCFEDARSTFEPLLKVRHKVFAHSDLVNFKLSQFPGIEPVDKAIDTLINISNKISESLEIGIEGIILNDVNRYHFPRWGDGDALLYKLRKYKESVFADSI